MALDVGVTQKQRSRIEPKYVLNKLAQRNRHPVSIRSEMEADEFGIHRGETYVPSMHRRHSSNGRCSQFAGGILALCIAKCRRFFKANGLSLFQKEGETKWQRAIRKRISQ
jgi:hypothetical protein